MTTQNMTQKIVNKPLSRLLNVTSPLADEPLSALCEEHGQLLAAFNIQASANVEVAVIGGGMSAEREVSFMSAKGVVNSLLELDKTIVFIDMGADIAEVLAALKPASVFNALHGTYGEDGCLPGLLNIMQIPYTGCGVLASSLALNKEKTYDVFRANDVRYASSVLVKKAEAPNGDPMARPYVIKPIAQGSSLGVEVVFDNDDFDFANYDFPYGDVLIEEYIKGKEIQVAVLDGVALGTMEIKLLQNKRFYDYEVKYTDGFAEHIMPGSISLKQQEEVMAIATKINDLLGGSGMVRAEFILEEKTNNFYALELNTHPGMTPLSICPEIAQSKGISYTELVAMMLSKASYE